ncbi:MAG: ABC transporter permease [Anaerolineae bacterium]|nr:ABC transporter permease [Anaerolineae bacterium]MDW8298009.1 ABC transporter permease [Anaerolineae bacterium]
MSPEITLGTFISVAAINAAIRGAVPIILGAMSGIVSERSGIVNIAIEGMMLFGAYAAFYTNVALSRSGVAPFLQEQPIRLGIAILAAALIGMALALLHAVLSIRFKVDQIISGTVINIFSLGMTGYLYEGGQNVIDRLPPVIRNPFVAEQNFLADLGAIIFDKGILTYTAFALVPILGFLLYRTTWGLRTRSVGENPRAADTLGVNVHRLQFTNLAISGVLAGLAGAVLVLEGVSFERGMSNGRGFIALAVMIFGAWRPSRVLFGALLFGYATALQSQLQFAGVQIPHQFVAMLPYVLTLIVLAGFMGRARPPAHIGKAYETE